MSVGCTVWTIGHSTRSIEELAGLLSANGIACLADIRSVPRSRRHPQFNADALPETLAARGIAYASLRDLGGLRRPLPPDASPNGAWQNASFRGFADYMQGGDFERGVARLLELAAAAPTAVMCAEAVPWRCHRSLVADALLARGHEVLHIIGPGRASPHRLTAFARLDGQRVTYPPGSA